MPFPIPLDPVFRKELIEAWVEDVLYRIEIGDIANGLKSWQIAVSMVNSLPPGCSDGSLEKELHDIRVKLDQHLPNKYAFS